MPVNEDAKFSHQCLICDLFVRIQYLSSEEAFMGAPDES